MGIGTTELFMFLIMILVPAGLWRVHKRRNRSQQEKQQKKAVGLVLVGAFFGAMVLFVLYVLVHHP
jgi:hypothetical protein